jgi:Cys-tRNA(Pro) deacylase
MSVESVKTYLQENDLSYEIMEFDAGTETVDRAAQALGVAPALIAKTLAFRIKDRAVLVVSKGDARIDNKKFKNHFQAKAKMMSPDEVLEITGHPVGGVCPFGLKQPAEIYLDESLRPFELVYPAAGSANSCIKISPQDIARLTRASWIDVCK